MSSSMWVITALMLPIMRECQTDRKQSQTPGTALIFALLDNFFQECSRNWLCKRIHNVNSVIDIPDKRPVTSKHHSVWTGTFRTQISILSARTVRSHVHYQARVICWSFAHLFIWWLREMRGMFSEYHRHKWLEPPRWHCDWENVNTVMLAVLCLSVMHYAGPNIPITS